MAGTLEQLRTGHISMATAARLLEVSVPSCSRYMRRGVLTPDGQRVRLRFARVGRRMVTTRAWLSDFIDQTTEAHIEGERPQATPTASDDGGW